MKLKLFSFLLISILLNSCKTALLEPKQVDFSNLGSNLSKREAILTPKDYYNFLKLKPNVQFMLAGGSINGPHTYLNQMSNFSIQGSVSENNSKYNYYYAGVAKLNDIEVPYNTTNHYEYRSKDDLGNLYGKVVTFDIPTPTGKYIDSLYVPDRIVVNSPIVNNAKEVGCISLAEDLVLDWVPDRNNHNGMLIMISYPPNASDPTDGSFTPYIFIESVPDNGKFVISKEILQRIPPKEGRGGADLQLIRASFKAKIDENTKQCYKIIGMARVSIDLN